MSKVVRGRQTYTTQLQLQHEHASASTVIIDTWYGTFHRTLCVVLCED